MGSYYYGGGGGFYCDSSSSPAITNSIFWDNSPNEISGDADITYSDIKGGYSGLGNINADPDFVEHGVYQLSSNSPCIDSGTPNGAPNVDIDNSPRPQGLGFDMGAYEFSIPTSAPTVSTGSATNITDSSATLQGTVNPNGGSSWYYFEYGTSTSYGSATMPESAAAGTSILLVSAGITGLSKNTYHCRIVGVNNTGTTYGQDEIFTTSPSAPSVTTDEATFVNAKSATLNGTINPNGAATIYYFEYGLTEGYGNITASKEAGSGASPVSVSSEITELELNKSYHFRLVATNEKGTTFGSNQTFTTVALAPEVTTDSATPVTSNSATLNGTINPNGANTTYYFEYGTTPAYGSKTLDTSAGSGAIAEAINAIIAGLNENTIYHFRLVATNNIGTAYGDDQTFTTTLSPSGPTVTTGSATLITSDSSILKGKVNPNGTSTEAYFEYGTTTSYGFSTPPEDIGAGMSFVTIDATVSDLIPDTTYHYRLTATNSEGTSSGADKTFFTSVIYVSPDGVCGDKSPCYSTIQEAIDVGISGSIIRITEGSYDENIDLNGPKTLTLSGGWDSNFTAQTSISTLISMTISMGTIDADKIEFQ